MQKQREFIGNFEESLCNIDGSTCLLRLLFLATARLLAARRTNRNSNTRSNFSCSGFIFNRFKCRMGSANPAPNTSAKKEACTGPLLHKFQSVDMRTRFRSNIGVIYAPAHRRQNLCWTTLWKQEERREKACSRMIHGLIHSEVIWRRQVRGAF